MKPLVSIVVPVYNMQKYLRTCIESLINQTFKDIEIILVNDGSIDSSGNICDEYAVNDKRIMVIHSENRGAGQARNTGIEKSTGDYIFFVDADDWIDPDCVEKCIEEARISTPDILIFGYRKLNKKSEIITNIRPARLFINDFTRNKEEIFTSFNAGTGHAVWNKLFKTSFIKENNLSFCDKKRIEDFIFLIECYKRVRSIASTDNILYNYRVLYGSAGKYDILMLENHINNYQMLLGFLDYPNIKKETGMYLFKIFVLWFVIVIPLNIVGNKKLDLKSKRDILNGIYSSSQISQWIKINKGVKGTTRDKILFLIFRIRDVNLLYLTSFLMRQVRIKFR
jgi:glycosyltransferase involved in cell wall biosynthesis